MRCVESGKWLAVFAHSLEGETEKTPDVALTPVLREAGYGGDTAHRHRRAVYEHLEVVYAEGGDDFAVIQEHIRVRLLLNMAHSGATFLRTVGSEGVGDDEVGAV
jgi:hypothetical protein